MATPLTINPSSLSISPSHNLADPSRIGPQLLSRPKLSLNTTSCTPRTLGRGNTGLRLDVLSADSPTSRNTYKNTYDEAKAASHAREPTTTSPPAATPSSSTKPRTPHPLQIDTSRRSSESSATSSTDSSPPHSPEVPYTIPVHIRPILMNSRLPKRARTTVSSATTPKVLFPPVKRVCFSQPLFEEVRNSTYKLRHSDILDLEIEEEGGQEESAHEEVEEQSAPRKHEKPALSLSSTTAQSQQRKTHEDEDSDDSDDATFPKTPIAGRRKKVREWKWTLGSSSSEDVNSIESNAEERHDPQDEG
ncbi:MAG: hypothetical protein M1828_004055 [Chrysothrix sp. TS-e1954]|nr:MAG: hypothetical protein M1828_004055 [Chrysothrix sp. TS-e1954]